MLDSTLLFLLVLVVGGTLANDIWRLAGVWLSRGVNPESALMVWVKDVSTALVAGVVARLLFSPAGDLAAVPWPIRSAAFAAGIACYFLAGRSLIRSIVYSLGVLLCGIWLHSLR